MMRKGAMLMDMKQITEIVEQVSQLYAEKFNIERDANWFILKLQEEVGELIQSYLMLIGQARTKGKTPEEIQVEFRKEIADVFCHVLLLANFYGVDLEKEMDAKWLARRKELRLSWLKNISPTSSSESTNAADGHASNEEALEEQEQRDQG
jgi:NTP pyrophosphatase (non-canonical NTP hydrolase)